MDGIMMMMILEMMMIMINDDNDDVMMIYSLSLFHPDFDWIIFFSNLPLSIRVKGKVCR